MIYLLAVLSVILYMVILSNLNFFFSNFSAISFKRVILRPLLDNLKLSVVRVQQNQFRFVYPQILCKQVKVLLVLLFNNLFTLFRPQFNEVTRGEALHVVSPYEVALVEEALADFNYEVAPVDQDSFLKKDLSAGF
jgi:hypothetical protein